jgi:uncharacterized protein YgiM (DUF1202 family)
MIRKLVVLTVLIVLFPTFSYCFDLYVHSVKAPLYQKPSMGSKKIIELKKGTKVTGLQEKANWYKVRHKGRDGWVYRLMVQKRPPLETKGLFNRLKSMFRRIHVLREKSRRRPSSYTTTAAARGLRDKRRRFADKYRLDYEAVEKIESIEISDTEALDFLTKGVSHE